MSWSENYTSLNALERDEPTDVTGDPTREVTDKARRAALDIIKSNVLGTPLEYDFSTSLSGTTNLGHLPDDPNPRDDLTITITQLERT